MSVSGWESELSVCDSVVLNVHALLQKFACNGTVIEHPEYGEVIQLQGDQRKNICQFLLEVSDCAVVRPTQLSGVCRGVVWHGWNRYRS